MLIHCEAFREIAGYLLLSINKKKWFPPYPATRTNLWMHVAGTIFNQYHKHPDATINSGYLHLVSW